jgi:hypothetical protein
MGEKSRGPDLAEEIRNTYPDLESPVETWPKEWRKMLENSEKFLAWIGYGRKE